MCASYSHDKALQTLFREDNKVSKLYNCSNKPVNASEERLVSECCTVFFCSECTPTFILYHQHSARWSGLFNYLFIMPIIGGGGGNFFFEGWTFCLGVIANIGGGGEAPPRKSVYCHMLPCLLPDRQTLQVIKERCHLGYITLTFVYTFCSISLFLHDVHNYFPQYYM